jgi:hypothetical protein
MKHPYGYIKGTKGADGEEVDAYVGPKKDAPKAFVVHQHKEDGTGFDEDKVMLGFKSKAEARKAFLAHYDSPKFLGPISAVGIDRLKELVASKKKLVKISKVRKYDDIEKFKAKLRPGDILATKAKKPSLHSKVISWKQGTPFGHVAIYEGEGKVIDTRVREGVFRTTVDEIHKEWGGGRGIRVLRPKASKRQRERALEIARDYMETPYSVKTLLRLLLPPAKASGKVEPGKKPDAIICSNLVTRAYPTLPFAKRKHRDHVMPVDIARSPFTRNVAELR